MVTIPQFYIRSSRISSHLNLILSFSNVQFSVLFSVIISLSISITANAQPQVIKGKVVDRDSKASLPFATLVSKRNGGGTIANKEGVFRLPVEVNDTVEVRYTGYEPFSYYLNKSSQNNVTFELEFSKTQLTEVNVVAADERAFNLIAKVRKQLLKSRYQRSKAFLEIFTEKDSIPTELLELYYNSNFRKGNVESLEYKSGRLAMAPVDGSFFKSYSTSRVIQSHNPLTSAGFPENVFTTKKQNLKKVYDLRIVSYGSGGETLIFDAKEDYEHSHFSGSISINEKEELSEVEFFVRMPSQIPFIPLFENDLLKPLELHITWFYTTNEKGVAPQLIDFGYANISGVPTGPDYAPPYLERHIKAAGTAYFYDFDDPFFTPQMVCENDLNDYQRMLNTPCHEAIWELTRPFEKSSKFQRNKQFLEKNGAMKTYAEHEFFKDYSGLESMVGHRNVFWSDTARMRLNLIYHQPNELGFETSVPRRKKFKLDVEMYFDLIEVDSTVSVYSQCLFDVYDSYYGLEHDSLTDLFLNLHFDLCEVERRRFETSLANMDQITPKTALRLYEESNSRLHAKFEKYFRETDSGTSLRALERYSHELNQVTGVDNLELFLPVMEGL